MARRYLHTFPAPQKNHYARLLTNEEYAKLAYNKDMAFRTFVSTWNTDAPELFAWTLTDFYSAYKKGGTMQLKLSF